MKGRKIAFLLILLSFGATVETAWTIRNHLGAGPLGCRVLRGKFYGPSFTFDAEERREVPEGTALEVDSSFGGVRIGQGMAGEVRVALRKVVFLPTEERARDFASRIRLEAALLGSTLRVSTNRRQLEREREGREVGFETHLEITVPPGTSVTVRNEHGRVDVADVATADLSGSFEPLRVERVAGAATLKSRHGGVFVSGVGGTLTLEARHGDVTIQDVQGHVKAECQHGDVSVARAGGLDLETSYGDVKLEAIRGDVTVRGQHAGVQAVDISGRVDVETSYRDVRLEKLGAEARVKAHHGGLQITDAQGPVLAEASYEDIVLSRIRGPVEATVEHGGLRGRDLEKGARVKVVGEDVRLEGVSGGVEVEAQRASVHFFPAGPLVEPVRISTSHGGIRLEVPAGSHFELEASVRRGEIAVDLPGLAVVPSGPDRVTGKLGAGGHLVKLFADQGDVRVAAVAAATSSR